MSVAAKKKKIFDGRYEILAIVGRGACSVVYHARHAMTQSSEVALKVLLNQRGGGSNTERLRKEALAMVSSRHKYVVRLDDFHSVKDLCYLAMEYAREGDLRKFINKRGGKLDMQYAELFFLQSAEALNFVHRVGITHRDLKPDNILVMSEREVRLADFGVAVLPGELASLEDLRAGVGTMSYMAPEVLEGKACDKLSDIYSLGVTFYEMLSGVHPFENLPLIKQLEAREDQNIKHLSKMVSDISPGFAEIIMRCMRYEPSARFPSMAELLAAFEKKSDPAAVIAHATQPTSQPAPQKSQSQRPQQEQRPREDRPQKDREKRSAPQQDRQSPAQKQQTAPKEARPTVMQERSRGMMKPPLRPPPPSKPAPKTDQTVAQTPSPKQERPVKEQTPAPGQRSSDRLSATTLKESAPVKDDIFPFEDTEEVTPFDEPIALEPNSSPVDVPAQVESTGGEFYADELTADQSVVAEEPPPPPPVTATKLRSPPSRPYNVSRKTPGDRPTPLLQRMLYAGVALIVGYIVIQRLFPTGPRTLTPNEPEQVALIPLVSAPIAAFPSLPDGMYVGSITGLVQSQTVPLTIVSMTSEHSLTFIAGLNGWTPIPSSYLDTAARQKRGLAEDEIQVISSGFVINFKGHVKDDSIEGTFKNVVTGEEGEWKVAAILK